MSEEPKDPEMNPATTTAIVLLHNRVCCPVHGEPFRAEYPKGYPTFMIKSFQEVTVVPGLWDECKRLTGKEEPTAKDLEAVFDVKPICCRLPVAKLVEVYEDCGIGKVARCDVCRVKRKGTPITASNVSYKHCCFMCIATASETPHN